MEQATPTVVVLPGSPPTEGSLVQSPWFPEPVGTQVAPSAQVPAALHRSRLHGLPTAIGATHSLPHTST